ncbi:MAG: O-antigen ligase family protein, partial [Anaerolineae bacterium]|nr:O-antigen ligase family protein [Anaerolineae bacterium]
VLERLAHWQAAIDMANTRPLTGIGFGNYETAYPDFAFANWQNPLGHAHNYYLNVLAETGLIGFHSYLVMWGLIILQNWRLLRKPTTWQQRGILVGLMGVWTHITIHSLLDKLYVNNLFLHAGVMLGILAVLNQELVVEYDCDSNCESC